MPRTSNSVDFFGQFDDLVPATRYMLEKHGDIVFPYSKYAEIVI